MCSDTDIQYIIISYPHIFYAYPYIHLSTHILHYHNGLYVFYRQEGWRLEHEDVHDSSSRIIYKGVVFNEMKGVFVCNCAMHLSIQVALT